MTNIIRVPIASASAIDDPRPWVDIALDGPMLNLDRANVGGRDLGRLVPTQTLDAAKARGVTDEMPMVLIIDLDEQTRWVREDEQPPECIAHLGWYDPASDTLRLLEFVEAAKEA